MPASTKFLCCISACARRYNAWTSWGAKATHHLDLGILRHLLQYQLARLLGLLRVLVVPHPSDPSSSEVQRQLLKLDATRRNVQSAVNSQLSAPRHSRPKSWEAQLLPQLQLAQEAILHLGSIQVVEELGDLEVPLKENMLRPCHLCRASRKRPSWKSRFASAWRHAPH